MNLLVKSFETSVEIVNNLQSRPSDDELLKIYAYYKQSTIGNNNLMEPSLLNIKARKKWNAWNNIKNMNKSIAMQNYINLATQLYKKYN